MTDTLADLIAAHDAKVQTIGRDRTVQELEVALATRAIEDRGADR